MFNNKIIPIFLWVLILQGCKDVEVIVEGNGRVYDIVDVANINCGSGAGEGKCKNSYGTGVDSVTFKAEPDPGYRLKTWGNSCQGDVCSSTFLEDIPELLRVAFERVPTEISYTYNASGQRVTKTIDGVTTFFIYQQDGSLLAELDANGNTLVDYIYLEGKPIAQLRPQNDGADKTAYIHADHIGVPKAATNQSGEVIWQVKITPFGEVYSEAGSLTQNQRFPGQYADQESGYSYNYFRDYDSSLGRYLQSDPIGLEGGLNTYAYVGGNPVLFSDPRGLASCSYSIVARRIVCVSNTADNPGFEGPPEIRTIDPSQVHSGRGEYSNDPNSANVKDYGPIPPGRYSMSPNSKPGRDGWWALQESGWNKFDSLLYYAGLKRSGANLHLGTVSHGCITVDVSAADQYYGLTDLLEKEAGSNWLNVTR